MKISLVNFLCEVRLNRTICNRSCACLMIGGTIAEADLANFVEPLS